VLFIHAQPIFSSSQFSVQGDSVKLTKRIRSILDFGETSNAARLEIWKASMKSIADKPILGVGINNFPVVLKQHTFLAKAGSSAHNIYLHIGAEMGVAALIVAIWMMVLIWFRIIRFVRDSDDIFVVVYGTSMALFFPWVMAYLITDSALFDERAFLIFLVSAVVIGSLHENTSTAGKR
jgi:O-antigen ligase